MFLMLLMSLNLGAQDAQPSAATVPETSATSTEPDNQEVVVEAFKSEPDEPPLWGREELVQQNEQYIEMLRFIEFVPNDFAAMVEGRFRQGDLNGDGKLSREELIKSELKRGKEPVFIPFGSLRSLRAEGGKANPYRARMLNLDPRMVKHGDMDGDNLLSRYEALVASLRQFKRMDRNGDMKVDGMELRFLNRVDAKSLLPGNL